MSREEYKGAIEVSVIFHEGQKMFAVPKQPAQQEPVFSFQMQLQPGWGSQYPTPCVIGDPDLRSLFGKVGDVVTFYTSPQPAQQEPVAWLKVVETLGGWGKFVEAKPNEKGAKPLYTSPPSQRTWQGLTDEDIRQCSRDVVAGGKENSVDRFAYAIEAKLKEKNT